ncbi:hypothetical protein NLI96_g6684 [Meripilus lineatus]|uniref:Uncharacterized protein n=1 Tax=Meripilus lineatus TaxID=2056292 RepID=A0AAD5V5S9_9APHY|nr:hypothetical protein NLI96_g6684 [Physisporinus lineatus]
MSGGPPTDQFSLVLRFSSLSTELTGKLKNASEVLNLGQGTPVQAKWVEDIEKVLTAFNTLKSDLRSTGIVVTDPTGAELTQGLQIFCKLKTHLLSNPVQVPEASVAVDEVETLREVLEIEDDEDVVLVEQPDAVPGPLASTGRGEQAKKAASNKSRKTATKRKRSSLSAEAMQTNPSARRRSLRRFASGDENTSLDETTTGSASASSGQSSDGANDPRCSVCIQKGVPPELCQPRGRNACTQCFECHRSCPWSGGNHPSILQGLDPAAPPTPVAIPRLELAARSAASANRLFPRNQTLEARLGLIPEVVIPVGLAPAPDQPQDPPVFIKSDSPDPVVISPKHRRTL